jgi:UDP-N-acetylmuramoyl-tripeptide--D-alanyl-D-alanine ligase
VKKLLRRLILEYLTTLAKKRIASDSQIVGITGSVGKTTCKEAAEQILASKFKILANKKSMNSEFGIPLTLLESESGFSNPLAWLWILVKSEFKSGSKLEAQKIILELGVDKPRDMGALLGVVKPNVGVFLNAKEAHLGEKQFRSVEEVAREKLKLIEKLPKDGVAILGYDDAFAKEVKTKAKKITFGKNPRAKLRMERIRESLEGVEALLTYGSEKANLKLKILGKHNLYPILGGIAIGLASGINLKNCVEALENFTLPPGRLNLLEGVNHAKIIDGSYNSNPASLEAALETLANLEAKRKIVVAGQMNELGEASERLHCEAAQQITKVANLVIGVFGDAKHFVSFAEAKKIPSRFFENANECGEWLRNEIRTGDLILVKGSQNKVRLEKCVEKLLANSQDREKLCRRGKYWQKH